MLPETERASVEVSDMRVLSEPGSATLTSRASMQLPVIAATANNKNELENFIKVLCIKVLQ
jgi:hypothetical protein